MDQPIYYRAERFFPTKEYESLSKIVDKNEIVSYDMILCKAIIEKGVSYIGFGGEVLDLKVLLTAPNKSDEQIIAYFENPTESHEYYNWVEGFELCGYDLSEKLTGISAVTNCGGMFAKAIPYSELNQFGLINTYKEAREIYSALETIYPNESHADCEIYELWRRLQT